MSALTDWLDQAHTLVDAAARKYEKLGGGHLVAMLDLRTRLNKTRAAVEAGDLENAVLLAMSFMQRLTRFSDMAEEADLLADQADALVNKRSKHFGGIGGKSTPLREHHDALEAQLRAAWAAGGEVNISKMVTDYIDAHPKDLTPKNKQQFLDRLYRLKP